MKCTCPGYRGLFAAREIRQAAGQPTGRRGLLGGIARQRPSGLSLPPAGEHRPSQVALDDSTLRTRVRRREPFRLDPVT
jgi:hypothetical protein